MRLTISGIKFGSSPYFCFIISSVANPECFFPGPNFSPDPCVKKAPVRWWPLFWFIFYIFSCNTFIHTSIRWGSTIVSSLHFAQYRGPSLGAEPGFELGHVVQQADELPSELRRTLFVTQNNDNKLSELWSGMLKRIWFFRYGCRGPKSTGFRIYNTDK